jgi:hypothetical protein
MQPQTDPWFASAVEPALILSQKEAVIFRKEMKARPNDVGYEVLTTVTMERFIISDITLCSLEKINHSSGGTYRLHLQGILLVRSIS